MTYCTINLRNGKTTETGEVSPIIPAINSSTTPGFNMTYHAIVVPQTIPAETPLFTVKIGQLLLMYKTETAIEILPQKMYIFNMVVGEGKKARILEINTIK